MKSGLDTMRQEAAVSSYEVLSQQLSGGAGENHENFSQRRLFVDGYLNSAYSE
jgi:hypothetical protein